MSDPLVSVVLPTFNRESTLRRAVHSVLGQSYGRLELVVVDDGSIDGTPEVMASIQDERVRVVRYPDRRGAAAARNVGIRASTGEYIAFQDSDDEWLPSKLERQVDLIDSIPEVGAVGGGYIVNVASGVWRVDATLLERGDDYEDALLEGHALITPVWLFRRHALLDCGLFDEALPCLEDWDLLLRLSEVTRLRAVAGPVLLKYGTAGALGGDLDRRTPAMVALLERHGHRWRASPARFGAFSLELALLFLRQGRYWRSIRTAASGLRHGRVHGRALAEFAISCWRVQRPRLGARHS